MGKYRQTLGNTRVLGLWKTLWKMWIMPVENPVEYVENPLECVENLFACIEADPPCTVIHNNG